jgi:hypothetical protein
MSSLPITSLSSSKSELSIANKHLKTKWTEMRLLNEWKKILVDIYSTPGREVLIRCTKR